jgi:hypothetical protein
VTDDPKPRISWESLALNAFEVVYGIASFAAMLLFVSPLSDLQASVIGREIDTATFTWVWVCSWGIGGAMMVIGLAWPGRTYHLWRLIAFGLGIELGGLILYGTAALAYCIAAISSVGITPLPFYVAPSMLGAGWRAYSILKTPQRLALAHIPELRR